MIYLLLFASSFILTYMIKNLAQKKSLLAEVNERSSHDVPTPHGGGIAIAITWFLGLVYFYMKGEVDERLFYALMSGIVISAVSFFDDLYGLSPKTRLIAQSITAFLGLYFLGGLDSINLFIFDINSHIFTNLFAFFMTVWFINLYNFLDGIDGYAGSEAVFLGVSGYILFGGVHFLVLIVSVLGFLFWNWHRAKIFMGDVGSTLLGYTVAVFTIYYANIQSSNFWVWIILFGLFWFDATLTLFRRYKNREKLSHAHKKHAYQRAVQGGLSHSRVVVISIVVNIVLLCLVKFSPSLPLALSLSILLLYGMTKLCDRRKSFS